MGDDLRRFFPSLANAYEFDRLLGVGGMAVVWLAHDLRHGRHVAVKLLKPDLLAGTGHGRFLREIGYLATLSHPNILPLFDSGEARDESTGVGVPFFTMPYIAGETLRERLAAQAPLPLDEAVAIVTDVAAGLDFAHAAGIVHRDIKPGNILLAAGRAVVADFGIARAVDAAVGGTHMTEDGARIGTPHYLAPESPADARSDQYALACVVHEMLTGAPPFEGNTPASVLARHLLDPPPSIAATWPGCPPGVDAAVRRALAKDPEQRFRSAGEFATVLGKAARGEPISAETMRTLMLPQRKLEPRVLGGAAILLVAALVIWWLIASWPLGGAGGAGLDSTRYVILQGGASGGGVEDEVLRDALLRWSGISVVDPFQAREVITKRKGDGAMRPALASAIAKRLGAGRYVLREVSRSGDSSHVRLAVYESSTNRLLGEHSAVLPAGVAVSADLLRQLADSALLGRLGSPPGGTSLGGSASLPAVEAFARGGEAIGRWKLTEAEQAFADALRYDASYPQATVWLALVRSWLDAPVATWKPQAMRADANRSNLSERDRDIAGALFARAGGDMIAACERWRALSKRYPDDFVPQYGLADCLVHDEAVIRDPSSRSGWRFRANFGEANDAYNRAFALFTPIYRSLDAGAPGSVRRVYQSRFASQRQGRAVAPDTGIFLGEATLEGDTIAFVPHPAREVMAGDPSTIPPPASSEGADRRLLRRQYEAITAWLDAAPDKAAPLAAMADALERLGDRSALDTLQRARSLAVDAAEKYRLAAAEVFLRLRISIPDDAAGIRRARLLADSLLFARQSMGDAPFERAGLAAITGRGMLAMALWRQPELTARLDVPPYLTGDAPALLVAAAMGGPADSIVALERRVATSIDREFAGSDRVGEQMRWLAPAATYAWPYVVLRSLPKLRLHGDPIVDATSAAVAGDSAAVRAALEPYTRYRTLTGHAAVTLDALPTEAQLRWDAGDRAGAVALLDGSLGTLFGRPGVLDDPLQAAGLIRAAVLRASYASATGDPDLSHRWAEVVRVLWSDMDPALALVVGDAGAVPQTTR